MKRLDQIEPRTLVDAAQCPGDGQASFVIARPGSYCLAGNLVGEPGRHGIRIDADDVSIDLNGFALRGAKSGGLAILAGLSQRGIRIMNGTIVDWLGGGIVVRGKGASVTDLKVLDCAGGIELDEGGATRISRCEVRDLTVLAGGAALRASVVEGCAVGGVFSPGPVTGIVGASVSGCDVRGVRSEAGAAGGILAGAVSGCRVSEVNGTASSFEIRAPAAPIAVRTPGAAEFPDGMSREEFRLQATEVRNELRLIAGAMEQWAIEQNRPLSSRVEAAALSPYIQRRHRLREQLAAGRCVDATGQPIRLPDTLDGLPAVSRRTLERFASVTPPGFWEPFPDFEP